MMHCKRTVTKRKKLLSFGYGWDWVGFDYGKNKINHLLSTCNSGKKTRLFIIFPNFFHIWKIALQISTLFQEFKTLYEPSVNENDIHSLELTSVQAFLFFSLRLSKLLVVFSRWQNL